MANQQIWLFLSSILLLSSADGHFLPGNYLLWFSLLDYILEIFLFGQITLVAMLIIDYRAIRRVTSKETSYEAICIT